MDDMMTVVDALNRPPFRKDLTLVEFHAKKPLELLQIINDVLTELDPKQKSDLRDEDMAAASARMIELLLLLNYKHGMDLENFTAAFMNADTAVLYPLLSWLLQRMPELKKRAYLARFLRNLDVPEEFFADDVLVRYYEKYKGLQQMFKDIHKQVDKQRQTRLDPVELQKDIEQLETEKQQLTNKLASLRTRVENDSEYHQVNFEELLDAVRLLRKEQEQESKLVESLEEQKQHLFRSEQRHKNVVTKLTELKSSDSSQDPMELLKKLQSDVQSGRHLLHEVLARQVDEKRQELQELSEALREPAMSADEVMHLEDAVRRLTDECDQLTVKRDKIQTAADAKIGFYRDRATAVEKRRHQVLEQVEDLEKDLEEAQIELRKANEELQQHIDDSEKPRTDAQAQEFKTRLQNKKEQYKRMKMELESIHNEVGVLLHTEEVLRSRDKDIDDFNAQLERKHGVSGAINMQDTLEKVSAAKSAADKGKGDALDDMAGMISRIQDELNSRKKDLAPMIKRLRQLRQEYGAVEQEYNERKRAYNTAALSVESQKAQVEQELQANVDGLMAEESSYHLIHSLASVAEPRMAMVESKQPDFAEMYTRAIQDQEVRAKELRKEQINVKKNHSHDVQQRRLFKNLHVLLSEKLRIQKETQRRQAQVVQSEQADYMKFADPAAGVDRMVFD